MNHSKKIVIVQITPSSTGGIGRLTRDICDILPEESYEKYIAYSRGKVLDKNRDFLFGTKLEVNYHGIMTRITDKIGYFSKRGTNNLISFLEQNKVDIIHLHNLHGYYINLEILFNYLKKKKIPIVWTLHDCWSFTGHCTHFSFIDCMRWKKQCSNCPQTSLYPKSFIDNSFSNYIHKKKTFTGIQNMTLITPSDWLNSLVKQSFLKEYQVKTINNGINLELFRIKEVVSSKINFRGKKIVLGLASTWNERKGFNDFLELSKILPESYIIVLVGLPKKKCIELPSNMLGITHTEDAEELVDLYNSAYIFLNLTYEDNFPTTNLEALACGTSVLTYKTGGSPESISDETGYVVNQGDLNKVKEIILNHKKNETTQNQCRNHSLKFDMHNSFGEYKQLYKDLA